MIICLCHRISDRDIAREVRSGCSSFDELQEATRVATACGACRDFAEATFDLHHAEAQCRGCAGAAACGAPSLAVALA